MSTQKRTQPPPDLPPNLLRLAFTTLREAEQQTDPAAAAYEFDRAQVLATLGCGQQLRDVRQLLSVWLPLIQADLVTLIYAMNVEESEKHEDPSI